MEIEQARFNMIEQQIRTWEVLDKEILNLLFITPREKFVTQKYADLAFSDWEIPLPGGQKMLYPKLEARLVQELKIQDSDIILEIGTGSGYVTSLLAHLGKLVYSIEISEINKQFALDNLNKAKITNVELIEANGLLGYSPSMPYDKIFIGGGLIAINDAIKNQLKIGGKLVGIIGEQPVMHGVLVERISIDEFKQTKLFESNIDYLLTEITKLFSF